VEERECDQETEAGMYKLSNRFATGALSVALTSSLLLAASASRAEPAEETIDFEEIPAGTIVTELFGSLGAGPILVTGTNEAVEGNAAVIFDSSVPTGGDFDLGSPNTEFGGPGIGQAGGEGRFGQNDRPLGGILILAESLEDLDGDTLVDDPDDAGVPGGEFEFDFSSLGSVDLKSFTYIDVGEDDQGIEITLTDEAGEILDSRSYSGAGNNGVTSFTTSQGSGTAKMIVRLKGSGGIDEIDFTPECDLQLTLTPDVVQPGDTMVVSYALTHRRDIAVTVPFYLTLETEDGEILLEKLTGPNELETGDTLSRQAEFTVPALDPGTYVVTAATREMEQGIEMSSRTFTVE